MGDKTFPKVGDKLYLKQFTGNAWVDMVKHPYTVIGVTNNKVFIQSCRLIFNGPRYFDTLPDGIEKDPNGTIEQLTWHSKRGMWGTPGRESDYPSFAIFGEWVYQPYLD